MCRGRRPRRPLHFGAMVCYAAKSLRSVLGARLWSAMLIPHSSFERRFPLHIVSHGTLPPFLPLYFAVLCNFTIIFGCFNVKNHLSRSIPLQTLFSLSKQWKFTKSESVIIKSENKFLCYRILTFLRHYILPFITLLAFSVTASEIIVLFFAKPIDVYYMLCYNSFIRSIRCEYMGTLWKYMLSLYRRKCLKHHKILYGIKLIKSLQITRWWQIKRWKLQNPPKISLKLTKCPRKIPCQKSLWEILLLQFSII